MARSFSYGRQTISGEDINAVVAALKSDWLTQGPAVPAFENALCEKFGSKYASVAANGTAGLHLIALGLGWTKGDLIITSPITFLASANCAIYTGADIDFADIDEATYTIDPAKLEDKIRDLSNRNKKIKAVVAVDYAGHPCDWDSLKTLKDKYGFQLVNDFCHALGAEYKNDSKYAVKYADAVNLSFHPVKHITTGEGGAVITDNEILDRSVKLLRTHGITKDPASLEKNDGPWYYEMQQVGFNYRITDFQCALGQNQLQRLEQFVAQRRNIAGYYDKIFSADDRLICPKVSPDAKHAYHLYPLRIKFGELKIDKKEYYNRLAEKNIFLQVHYVPIHLQPFYSRNFGFKAGDFPISEKYYEQVFSIPIYPALSNSDLEYISATILEALNI
jgi:perosamine synthetase